MKKYFALAAAALLAAAPANATATLIINGSGTLTGATGVDVGGFLYDVAFVDGTCASVFGACSAANFDFTSLASANVAGQSLLDNVFVGAFDANAGLTFGCSAGDFCIVLIPYALGTGVNAGTFFASSPINGSTGSQNFSNDPLGSTNASTASFTSSGNNNFVFANFTATGIAAVAAVPEPSTWAMMLMGFGAMGFALRRRKRNIDILQGA